MPWFFLAVAVVALFIGIFLVNTWWAFLPLGLCILSLLLGAWLQSRRPIT